VNSRRTTCCAFFLCLGFGPGCRFNVRHYWTYGVRPLPKWPRELLTTWVDTQIQHSGVMGIDLMTTSRCIQHSFHFLHCRYEHLLCVLNHVALTNELTGVVTVVDGTSPELDFSERGVFQLDSGKLEHHEVWSARVTCPTA